MITVLGASGFIGSNLVRRLEELGKDYLAPGRDDEPGRDLGDVIYCIGLTSDFRSRPLETVEAHVCKLLEVLRRGQFDSLLYLSSTRLYGTHASNAAEEDALRVLPSDPSDLYNLSKAMGEALAFASGKKIRIARLSNVYGDDFASGNFLSSIIKDAVTTKETRLRASADSQKDYINVELVVDTLIRIATGGKHRTYNLASGINTSNRQLTDKIRELTGCRVYFDEGAPEVSFPPINIERIRSEFGVQPSRVLDDLTRLIDSFRTRQGGKID